ncbi:malectin domain-containing carbohydrate-binding protein [Pedobacter sp.]|uniref:malectin domain-containing carbohydrate-binding protein n=1 Tax=Pedobacter sp. TaxID=1411316 RepID=UPI003BA9BF1D
MMRCSGWIAFLFLYVSAQSFAQQPVRSDILLNHGWKSIADEKNIHAFDGFEQANFNHKGWINVNVPHNWDQYEGYQRKIHGNKHGYAWYKKIFKINRARQGKQFFLYFEGVGSYATIWLNGKKVGYHAGGRTTFTLNVTHAIKLNNSDNVLAVRADHPANIQDLPWVDGGCSTERGFSEGSQPMGIFRPVHLIVTNDTRVQPFGVHIWNDNKISEKSAFLNIETTLKNYSTQSKSVTVVNKLTDETGKTVQELKQTVKIPANREAIIAQKTKEILNPKLWSLAHPYLYQLKTTIVENGKVVDEQQNPYGIRWISWPIGATAAQKQFFLNGKPVFINGIAEYEHMIGQSHAFSEEQISTRVRLIKAAGFNAFRDAHQPHNLLYSDYWDKEGILCWTQMAAHIWYDTPEFRKNFKTLLTDWVKERRNSPAVVLWGLENESTLPEDFARECTELIRKLDPTASSQRKVTTCNGGKGTDWDVPQNWTGTYGGNPLMYGEDLKRQVLVGEYGAWRTIDLHEVDSASKTDYSENYMTTLMETKVHLAESVKDQVAGHFFWLYSSHDNPGRVQGGEGLRDLDRVGPVNYKGMFTPWEEPTDAYYMFRANYAPKQTDPMVYIVSHTWPNRWSKPGVKDSIVLYSNCDEVELFNDVNSISLGKLKHKGVGSHFQWNRVDIHYNVLYAIGYVNGKAVAKDVVVLNSLPQSPKFDQLYTGDKSLLRAQPAYNYLYRLNCGGADYKDEYGQLWLADQPLKADAKHYGSSSWTAAFDGVPAFFASQRRTFSPINGTKDWKLFQSFRYGRDQLKFSFPIASSGEYLVELYFAEPWLGIGGGLNAEKMRLFDVAVNDEIVLKDLDIWKSAGANTALKKTIKVKAKAGNLVISFPNIKSGQAVISAIAVASLDSNLRVGDQRNAIVALAPDTKLKANTWLDLGDKQYQDSDEKFSSIPSNLFGAEWLQPIKNDKQNLSFKIKEEADVFVGVLNANEGLTGFEDTKTKITNDKGGQFLVYRKRIKASEIFNLKFMPAVVVIVPPSDLAPAYDLKTVTSYKATDAKLIGQNIGKKVLMGKERVVFNQASGDALQFEMSVGVADTYSLTLKYHNPTTALQKIKMEFYSIDGTLMRTEELELSPTKEGKWNYLNTNTGSMVNAGKYLVKFMAISANGLAIDALDVQ